ncbi:uncharacterized protein N7487_006669 [Penicillium crustosum]|uniref:uncharacterized protein n=1 Tax=Penicillium crustosum TaxID=36656 RepID=UPI0023910434|nr:uncharacterized protein N7487_006669 [Penicillium crustosum]KAJ5412310.1 hypothetical protein N7487_006669 [Penicillium crustosum]
MNTANLLNWSVVPKPSTGRMLLSAKTCRGCRSLPKAAKWDSAAFDFRLPRLGLSLPCWFGHAVLLSGEKAEAPIDLYPIGLSILGLIQNTQREFCLFRSRIKLSNNIIFSGVRNLAA